MITKPFFKATKCGNYSPSFWFSHTYVLLIFIYSAKRANHLASKQETNLVVRSEMQKETIIVSFCIRHRYCWSNNLSFFMNTLHCNSWEPLIRIYSLKIPTLKVILAFYRHQNILGTPWWLTLADGSLVGECSSWAFKCADCSCVTAPLIWWLAVTTWNKPDFPLRTPSSWNCRDTLNLALVLFPLISAMLTWDLLTLRNTQSWVEHTILYPFKAKKILSVLGFMPAITHLICHKLIILTV